jgi:3-oxoacyl-[acyl-carrier protein] reductase
VVTGASSGIGAAVASALAAEGAAVVGFARRFTRASIDETPAPGKVLEVHLDITEEDRVKELFAELDHIDVLVNSAGSGTFAPLTRMTSAELRTMLDVHVMGTFLCCRAALRSMQLRRSGHIVNISSLAATRALVDCSGYSAAKAGQLGMARAMREEMRSYGVRVTSVEAGAVDTPIWDSRPGFDRAHMLAPRHVAAVVVDAVRRTEVAVEELVVVPPRGVL